MTEDISQTDNAFATTHKEFLTPHILGPIEKVAEEMGYSEVNNNDVKTELNKFEFFFNRTGLLVDDPNSLTGNKTVNDSDRETLSLPTPRVLEKDGVLHFEFTMGPNLKIITETNSVETILGLGKFVEGLPIKHVFIGGDDQTTIDITKLRMGDPVANLLSFSGRGSGFSPARSYSEGGKVYPAEIYITMPTNKNDGRATWDPDSFKFLFMHENDHAYLSELDLTSVPQRTSYVIERDANALALNTTRKLQRLFPEANYLNIYEHQHWLEQQLLEGYDTGPIDPKNTPLESVASSNLRKNIRIASAGKRTLTKR